MRLAVRGFEVMAVQRLQVQARDARTARRLAMEEVARTGGWAVRVFEPRPLPDTSGRNRVMTWEVAVETSGDSPR